MRLALFVFLLSRSFLTYTQEFNVPAYFHKYAEKYPDYIVMKGSDKVKSIALTFDDGPSDATSRILNLLNEHQIKATFFWQGTNLIQHPQTVKRAITEGHLLANHSWNHPNGNAMVPDALWNNQIAPTNKVYDSLYGVTIEYYRPPFGAISEEQLIFLAKRNIATVLWSHSTLDWDGEMNTSEVMIDRFRKELHSGAIALMHDVDFNNTLSEKLIALELMIEHGKSEGFQFVTIDKLNEL
ncbi:MAG: polysaccharide deacetylase family protein [Cyclobacteriaceae bacterium]